MREKAHLGVVRLIWFDYADCGSGQLRLNKEVMMINNADFGGDDDDAWMLMIIMFCEGSGRTRGSISNISLTALNMCTAKLPIHHNCNRCHHENLFIL